MLVDSRPWLWLTPPPVEENDAKKGILSLLERGLIPPTAQLTLDPPPVKHRVIQLHDPEERNRLQQVPGLVIPYIVFFFFNSLSLSQCLL